MKKIINIVLASALLVGATSSCSDFLQKDPPSSPSQSIFWQKKSDFESALAGSFSMVYEWPGVMSQIVACFDNLTDNTSGYVTYMYKHCYQGIARVHLLMENMETYQGNDMSADEKSFMVAQAKALRGYFYSWLYQCYREVPLVTSSLTMDNMYQTKSSRADICSDYERF